MAALMEVDALLKGLGRALRERRQAQGLSQEKLSLASGVHRNYVGGIERGERSPSMKVILRLSAELNVKPHELLRRAEELAREPSRRG